ncbi:helix-turn-helix domain-containing protein [Actinopolyspora mortivallis]|uniref:helix-turn-helix domain-containing protein n=1 Tax=Actinopolyspora mortivallis TaxID=33906 RepID=UPI0003709515|nr:helix-turn-helix transcriptional regulator [Actinopolyspora mortivallis]
MTPRSDAGWLRRRIGRELRTLRELAPERTGRKISTSEAAAELGCTQPKITSMEQGKYRLRWRDVRDLLDLYGATASEKTRLINWAKRSNEPIWWAPFSEVVEDWFADLIGGEGEAQREITYEHGLVPGLLQSRQYVEALTRASPMVDEQQHDLVVGLRLERQNRLLDEEDPLVLEALVEESVLWRPVGSEEVMREQLDHLVKMGRQSNVDVRVVPTSAGAHAAIDGSFILLEFAEFLPAVYLQQHPVMGARYSDEREVGEAYTQVANQVREVAYGTEESLALIESVRASFSG